jgi:RNA polymerase sigma-70 factor (ECF subfamily)
LEDGHRENAGPAWKDTAESALQQRETRTLVRECIDRLPESYRTVLLLRDIEELDTEEAAQLLGVSPNAVKIRLHRARQALRTLLDPYFREDAA